MSQFSDLITKASRDWKAPKMMDWKNNSQGLKLPFSSPLMNWATYGGIPRNKITEFFGDYGSGKSTTCMDLCKNAINIFQKEWEDQLVELRESSSKEDKLLLAELEETGPKKVLYVDLEHSFDAKWANTIGIDTDALYVMQPPDTPAEQILELIKGLVESNEAGLIVLDSLPSLVTEAQLNKKFGERTVASLAGLLTDFSRKMVPLLTRYSTTLILINQIRENMDNPYVVKTPGGKAVPFYCSLRIQCMLGNPIDISGKELPQKTEDPAGYLMKVRIHKQKSAPNDRRNASYYLLCDGGIRPDIDYAQLAVNKYGIIRKSGAWFTVCDPYTGEILENEDGKPLKLNGILAVYDYLSSNPEYFNDLKNFIEDDINGIEHNPEDFIEDEEEEEETISVEEETNEEQDS